MGHFADMTDPTPVAINGGKSLEIRINTVAQAHAVVQNMAKVREAMAENHCVDINAIIAHEVFGEVLKVLFVPGVKINYTETVVRHPMDVLWNIPDLTVFDCQVTPPPATVQAPAAKPAPATATPKRA